MMILENLALFLRIVEKGGLAPAGRELGLSHTISKVRLVLGGRPKWPMAQRRRYRHRC